ncbi:hypothetical protein [Williamsia deligens]|uniref:Condensation domain-containing protein n=1 Tax=Williamsia deligens TaxID=321325 RepID=A0ABW3GAH5_9NOCA|nr:hypothetical protein [Williamsia deligens]MCP2196190.1 hypothetical protein [Williamsia deligens]
MAQRANAVRLDGPDLTYWFVERALGWSVVLQLVWVFPDRLCADTVDGVAARLHGSGLHRRVVPAVVPGARPRWTRSTETIAAVHDDDPIDLDDVAAWADRELYGVDLDAVAGRSWRVRAVPIDSGGHALSLCTLHLVTDGQGFVRAAAEAFASAPGASVTTAENGSATAAPTTGLADLVGDTRDLLRQVAAAATGVARVVASTAPVPGRGPREAPRDPRTPRTPLAQRAPQARPRWVIASVPTVDWDAAASRHDGTDNTLFVAVIAGALRRAGAIPAGEPVKVGIPVSRRGADDDRANATAGVSVMLDDTVGGGRSLAGVRAACRAAYTALDGGRRDPTAHLTPLVTLLPPAVTVRAVTAGSGMPDAMTSNIGAWDDDVLRLGTSTAERMVFRGDAQHVLPDRPHRFGDGLQSWIVRAGDHTTLSVAAFDETAVPDADTLRSVLADEFAAWGLPHRFW